MVGGHVNGKGDRMYNKKLLLFDMEVGYQSELKWNLQAKMIIAGFMSLNLKSPIVSSGACEARPEAPKAP